MTLRPCPIGFFCIPDKLVGDGSGRKGRIFARFVKLLYYKKISVLLIYRWSNIFFFVKCFCEHVKMRPVIFLEDFLDVLKYR